MSRESVYLLYLLYIYNVPIHVRLVLRIREQLAKNGKAFSENGDGPKRPEKKNLKKCSVRSIETGLRRGTGPGTGRCRSHAEQRRDIRSDPTQKPDV